VVAGGERPGGFWGAVLITVLVHALLYGRTDEHTLSVVLMEAWVGVALIRIGRGRRHEGPEPQDVEGAAVQPGTGPRWSARPRARRR